jgi:TolA-binding protein
MTKYLFLVLALLTTACGADPVSEPPASVNNTVVDPNSADEKLFQAALADYDALNYAAAAEKFNQLTLDYSSSPRHDNAGYLYGRCLYEQRLFPDSITAFEAMLLLHPGSNFVQAARFFLGRARFRLGSFTASRSEFEAAIAADPAGVYVDNAEYYVGRSQYEDGNFAEAVAAFQKFRLDYPDSVYSDNSLYYEGRSQFGLLDFAGALVAFDAVLAGADSIYFDNSVYWGGRSLYAQNDLANALTRMERVETEFAGSVYIDNSLYYIIRIHTDLLDCPAAAASLAHLGQAFPQSTYLVSASDYKTANGCP